MKKAALILLWLFLITDSFTQTVIHMELQNGIFVVPCKVNGLRLKFFMDTGASGVSISLIEASFMLKNGYLQDQDIKGTGYYKNANGEILEGTEIILREVEIGQQILMDVEATIVNNNNAPILLGQTVLSKLGKFEIDYENNTLTLLNGPVNPVTKAASNADSLFYSGIEKDKHDHLSEALQDYSLAIELDPLHGGAYYNRGLIKMKLLDFEGAIIDLTKAIEQLPHFADAYNNRGIAKNQLNDFHGAIMDFSRAIELKPTGDETYYINRANTKLDLSDYYGSISDCDQAILINPNNPNSYVIRGISYIDCKNYKRAIQDFDTAIEYYSNFAEAYLNRGIARILDGDQPGACADWSKAGELGMMEAYDLINRSCK